jgi:prepilin-type N-terminal cleavage/methylation domain-containing protein
MTPLTKKLSCKGFTLIETICVVVVMGILSSVTYSYYKDAISAAQDKQAIAAAQSINGAKKAYELRVSSASTTWDSKVDDNNRFLLIRDRISFAESQTLADFIPSGYRFELGTTLKEKTIIYGLKGNRVNY